MGRIIIKQPNGLYCQWSTIVDDVVSYDETKEDIINDWVEDERERITATVSDIVMSLNAPDEHPLKRYYGDKKWDELPLKTRRMIEKHA